MLVHCFPLQVLKKNMIENIIPIIIEIKHMVSGSAILYQLLLRLNILWVNLQIFICIKEL